MIEFLRTIPGEHGSVVLEWADGALCVWLADEDGNNTHSVVFDRIGVYNLYADLAVINAAAGAYAQRPSPAPLDAT